MHAREDEPRARLLAGVDDGAGELHLVGLVRRDVEDHVDAVHGAAQRCRVAQVADVHLDALAGHEARGVADQDARHDAAPAQGGEHLAAHQSGAAQDEDRGVGRHGIRARGERHGSRVGGRGCRAGGGGGVEVGHRVLLRGWCVVDDDGGRPPLGRDLGRAAQAAPKCGTARWDATDRADQAPGHHRRGGDDMTTHSTATRNHPQVDLPGQTFVAEGPNDHTGMYVMHHAFRRDLAAFASSVRATPFGDPETWEVLGRRWSRFAATLHHHHTAEDTIYWPALLTAVEARGTEADLVEVRAMSEEHADIDPLVDGVRRRLRRRRRAPVRGASQRARHPPRRPARGARRAPAPRGDRGAAPRAAGDDARGVPGGRAGDREVVPACATCRSSSAGRWKA